MFKLRSGITGFLSSLEDKKEAVSFGEFKGDMYELARRINAQVTSCISFDSTENYFQCLLSFTGREICVLCNVNYPYIGVCISDNSSNGRKFLNMPEIQEALAGVRNYEVLSPDILDLQVGEADISALSAVEIKEIRHWQPYYINEVIFNEWD